MRRGYPSGSTVVVFFLKLQIQGEAVIRYSEGPSIRYSEGPSIRYNGPKFPDFLRKGSRYKVQWVKIANFFGKGIFPIFYGKGPAIRYNGRSNREKNFDFFNIIFFFILTGFLNYIL